MAAKLTVLESLALRLGEEAVVVQPTKDDIPTAWVPLDQAHDALSWLVTESDDRYRVLYDLTAIDERNRQAQEESCKNGTERQGDFTLIYHLMSYEANADLRLKVALKGEYPSAPTVSDIWPSGNWYEREVFDMFGIGFDGHPCLRRILMPLDWEGHPLRKEHPSRATEMEPYRLPEERLVEHEEALRFRPDDWGLSDGDWASKQLPGAGKAVPEDGTDYLFLNLGPNHPGTHGLLRLVLKLDGERIVDVIPDIGFHHRGAEKMAERQTFHTYLPYTDRIDYLSGVNNNLAYLLAVEKLSGTQVPERAKIIRVLLCELFRIASHLVWIGTFGHDVGAISPVFFTFTDREKLFDVVEAITGGRMHPTWFRIGGVAMDLPNDWRGLLNEFLKGFEGRLKEYEDLLIGNPIFRARTRGVGAISLDEAIDWGVTGPNLRACGFEWDFRKKRPYSDYDQFDFEIPTADGGDCFARAAVRFEEIRQSLRIIRQAAENMPAGNYIADDHMSMPPSRDETMVNIETLIHHFVGVSWGFTIPAGEAHAGIEAPKGNNGYYIVADGGTSPYRLRIRTPSFAHMQILPQLSRGSLIADLITILGSIDYVLADIDR